MTLLVCVDILLSAITSRTGLGRVVSLQCVSSCAPFRRRVGFRAPAGWAGDSFRQVGGSAAKFDVRRKGSAEA